MDIQSDIENLAYTKEYIAPLVAGDHILTFMANTRERCTQQMAIALLASDLDLIDLVLSEHAFLLEKKSHTRYSGTIRLETLLMPAV